MFHRKFYESVSGYVKYHHFFKQNAKAIRGRRQDMQDYMKRMEKKFKMNFLDHYFNLYMKMYFMYFNFKLPAPNTLYGLRTFILKPELFIKEKFNCYYKNNNQAQDNQAQNNRDQDNNNNQDQDIQAMDKLISIIECLHNYHEPSVKSINYVIVVCDDDLDGVDEMDV
jgi:hypothetical protein